MRRVKNSGTVLTGVQSLARGKARALPDEESLLLERCRANEQDAWRELIETHKQRVYSLAFDMMHEAEEAEDVAQEVFISAFRAIGSFRGDCRISTWLYRITKNTCLNRLRQRDRVEIQPLEDDYEPETEEMMVSSFDCSSPEELFLKEELRQWVRKKVDELPVIYRTAIVLCDLQQLSYQEAAKILGIPVGTLKSQVSRARRMLKEKLEEYIFGSKRSSVSGRQ